MKGCTLIVFIGMCDLEFQFENLTHPGRIFITKYPKPEILICAQTVADFIDSSQYLWKTGPDFLLGSFTKHNV